MFLILCGSSMSFMEDEILAYRRPLYGRRTAQLKILPLPYWESVRFFSAWPWEEQLYAYGICGGVPQYLEAFARHKNLRAAVQAELLTLSGQLFEEPGNLMKQEMREPALYNTLIASIANGASKLNEIATVVKKESRELTTYLRGLLSLGIIEKIIPVGDKRPKKTIYRLCDNLYRFWYCFIPECLPLISLGLADDAWDHVIAPRMSEYFGRIFESVCLQYIQYAVVRREIPIVYTQYGTWWGTNPHLKREEEIDVIALSDQHVLVGECKWRNERTGVDVHTTLKDRAALIQGQREVRYYIFSRSEFTADLKRQSDDQLMLVRAQDMLIR